MKDGYELYFWEPEISPHKLPLFLETAAHPRVSKAYYIAEAELNAARKTQGWASDFPANSSVLIGPTPAQVSALVQNSSSESVHVFSGMHWRPRLVEGIRAAIRHRRRFGILHEPRVLEGAKGLARLAHSWLTEHRLRKHADFILAIGAHGPEWFRLSGFEPARIFEFAYFIEDIYDFRRRGPDANRPHVVFLGRLERAKGLHLFLESLPRVKSHARFTIVGAGSLEGDVRSAAARHDNLDYAGVLPMQEIAAFLQSADILVLPSITKDDGWGVVVSEALMSGLAVVCSERVGASICISDEKFGAVVLPRNGGDIAEAIDKLIGSGALRNDLRQWRAAWARQHLDQRQGAEYLLAIFDHLFRGVQRPRPYFASGGAYAL